MRRVEAHLEFKAGEKAWKFAIFDSEHFDMDSVMDALDCYNRSSKLAFEIDTEIEAIAEALLGKILFKGLKSLDKARRHLADAVRLAPLLYPKVATEEPWY